MLDAPQPHAPAFNIPTIITLFAVALLVIHALRQWLEPATNVEIIWRFAFIPGRYGDGALSWTLIDVWTFVSYSLLHASWTHLIVNLVWMLAFGAIVARRIGSGYFIALSIFSAITGAVAHLVTHWGEWVPMIGASAAISGYLGAALRFAFDGAPLPAGSMMRNDPRLTAPLMPLSALLRQGRVLVIVLIWGLINIGVALAGWMFSDNGVAIAWQAHIGGFLAGFIAFRMFDPVGRVKNV